MNAINVESWVLKSSRLLDQQATHGKGVQERRLLTFAELPGCFTFVGGRAHMLSCYIREQHNNTVKGASVTQGG